MNGVVIVRDVNGNTLGRIEVDGTPEPLEGGRAGDVRAFDNGAGWVVTLYRREDA